MRSFVSKSLEDTKKIAHDWLSNLVARKDEALIIGLRGNLGAGKTTFVQMLARELGVAGNVTSPTFVIMKKYELGNTGIKFRRLVHIDAYRLDGGKDLAALDFEGVASDPDNLVLIEWPEKIENGLPRDMIYVDFEHVSEGERKIIFS